VGTDEVMVGCDPHKRTLTAAVVDGVGVPVDARSFSNTPAGLEAVVQWLGGLDWPVTRVGVEGSAGWGRHLTMALTRAGYDVREVNARRTADSRRKRRRAKTDREDAFAIARETAADAELPPALPAITDEAGEILATLVQRRKFLVRRRQQILAEAEVVVSKMDLALIERLPSTKSVKTRLNAVRRGALDHASGVDAERLVWLVELIEELDGIAARVKQLEKRLGVLVDASGSTLTDEVGIGPVSAAELLVEVNNPARFSSESKFARWCGIACVPVSSGEGDGEPIRHRLDLLGNRQVNRILHGMSITQTRCGHEPTVAYIDRKRAEGKSKREARRAHKRRLANRIIRRMWADQKRHNQQLAAAA
jgi:transposase